MSQSPFNSSRVSAAYMRAGRSYAYWRSRPSWVQRLVGGVLLLVFIGLAALILIPALLIGVVLALVATVVVRVRRLLGGIEGPPADNRLRRNVRVRQPH